MKFEEQRTFCSSPKIIFTLNLNFLLALLFGVLLAGYSFAALVAYRAAGFASRLAGASAFSAARYLFNFGFCYRLNHIGFSLKFSFS